MKSLYIYLSAIILIFSSCEDVVDVDLKNDNPRLVVEALINWEKGTPGNEQTILLRKSSSFVKEEIITANGATVTVTHENGTVFTFTETNPGMYTTTNFQPEIDATYTLDIDFEGEQYRAVEKMISVPTIKRVEQRIEEFGGEDIPIGIYYFDDTPEEENFYLENIKADFQLRKDNSLIEDEFTDGNEIEIKFSSTFEDPNNDDEIREYTTGDLIEIKLFGISEQFFNFFEIIEEQSDPDIGPFSIAPAEARGNCLNLTNPKKPAFGYFRLSETSTKVYTYK